VRLFRKTKGYLHMELHRDTADPRRYVTIDSRVSQEVFEAFRRE